MLTGILQYLQSATKHGVNTAWAK
uniref:Uncharacterized protein n=1 Tax=Anguilla anguilla TaxID=7936 RepID=A0A0E9VFM8_ANGAN